MMAAKAPGFPVRGGHDRHFNSCQLIVEGPKEVVRAVLLHGRFRVYARRFAGDKPFQRPPPCRGLEVSDRCDDLYALAALARRGGPLAARRAAAHGGRPVEALARLGLVAEHELDDLRAELETTRVELLDPAGLPGLGDLADPPAVLFAWGSPPKEAWTGVAVVGTRAATPAGMSRAEGMAQGLALAGAVVVSGLALGIDGSAHRGALAATGRTIGILGGGHGRFFPPANRALAREIVAAGGCVLSEYPPLQAAFPHQFLERNRLVAALARGVVVVESGRRGGAINTAGWAMEMGREAFAVPWDVDRPKGAGCLRLLREGARAVGGADDICQDLGLAVPPSAQRARRRLEAIAGVEGGLAQRIVEALTGGECLHDQLAERCGAPIGLLRGALSILEIHGVVEDRGGGRVALAP
ncbi:DNA-protecting protein DprA [bacterium]|nr:MAG: DNA-protecting protein DprA [bacterium]